MRLDDIKEELDGVGKIIGKYDFERKRIVSKDRTFWGSDKDECSCDKERCSGNCNCDDHKECSHCDCYDNERHCRPYKYECDNYPECEANCGCDIVDRDCICDNHDWGS